MKEKARSILSGVMSAVMLSGVGIAPVHAENTATARNAKLTVDVSKKKGDIIHGAAGFLYGIADEEVPTSNTVVPLKPKVLCTGTMLTTEHPYGDAEYVTEQFLEDGGEQVMMYLPNYYGFALGVSADYKEYAKVMKDYIVPHVVEWKNKWKEKHGVPGNSKDNLGERIDIDKALIYLPINEGAPRNGTDDFGVAWNEYYKVIKEVDPNATIGGVNEWSYDLAFGTKYDENGNSEGRNYNYDDFLPFCIENNCMPDIITWHELDPQSLYLMEEHTEDFKTRWNKHYSEALEKNGGKLTVGDEEITSVPEVPQICINEYATMDDCGVPGRLVNWIARFEDNGLYACLPFWHQANSLNDLASDANEGSGSWWTYKWYGDMSGKLLDVNSNTEYNELYGLATIDDNKQNLKVLLGGKDGSSTVQIENITDASTFKNSKKVHIKVQASDYAGMIGTQFDTDVVLEGNFPVNKDGSVMFDLHNMKFSSSFYVTITKTDDELISYTAPYIGYYEAENALAADGCEIVSRYAGGDHWGASSYISDDNMAYMRTKGAKITYTINVPVDGRYELNFIYGNGEGSNRNEPEKSLTKNIKQTMSIDGGEEVVLTMTNTMLTNTTGSNKQFVDLRAGEHTVTLVSAEDGELLQDLMVVKYKGAYGEEIVYNRVFEAEDFDFNELAGNAATTVSTKTDLTDYSGSGYVTGLNKSVTDGGGIRNSVVVRESGIYNVTLRYRADNSGTANIYLGNTAATLDRKAAEVQINKSDNWCESSTGMYLEKGINVVDIDADVDIKLDYIRVSEGTDNSQTVNAKAAIPSEYESLYETVTSDGASEGAYVKGLLGGDTVKNTANGIEIETAKTVTEDEIILRTKLTNTSEFGGTFTLRADMYNAEYAEYSDVTKEYNNETSRLDFDEKSITVESGETKEVELKLDAKELIKLDDYPNPNYNAENNPLRKETDTYYHKIKMTVLKDENVIVPETDVTYAADISAKENPGQYLEFKYNAAEKGMYKLQIFHSNDELCGEHPYNTKIIDRYLNVAVTDKDGVELSDNRYFFINSYSRDTFKEKTITLELNEGENTIKIYNDDSVSRWYGGDVGIPSQLRQKNYTPNLDKFIITPATVGETTVKEDNVITVSSTVCGYAATDKNTVPDGGDFNVTIAPETDLEKVYVNGVDRTADAVKNSDGTYTLAVLNVLSDVNVNVHFKDVTSEYEDEYIKNAGFGTGTVMYWDAENVEIAQDARNSYDGYYAMLTKNSKLSQTVQTNAKTADCFISVYAIASDDTAGKAYLTVTENDTVTKKPLAFGNTHEATVLHYKLTGNNITVGIDTSELDSGTVYVDNFHISDVGYRTGYDNNCEYFVDCGDHYPETITLGEKFGKRNSVTDKAYGVDENTGYKWGVVVTEDDPIVAGWAPSEGVWTKWTWPAQWDRDRDGENTKPKTESYRGTWGTQVDENGYTDTTRYVRYKFELDPGEYELKLGFEGMWWSGGPYTVLVNGEKVGEMTLVSEDLWETTVWEEGVYTFSIPENEDSALISVESYGSDGNKGANIWLNYIFINDIAEKDESVIFEDDFSSDTTSEYDVPNASEINHYDCIAASMKNGWDDTNGIRRDITEFLMEESADNIQLSVSLDAKLQWYGTPARVFFEVINENGNVKNTYDVVSGQGNSDDEYLTLSGSTQISYAKGDRVYLCTAHPCGYHTYDNITVKSEDTRNKISDETDMWNAYNNGGDYILGEDRVIVTNVGSNNNSNTGTIDGLGGTIIKGVGKDADSILFHNDASKWTYKNMIIDGNKNVVTHTDACIWIMNDAEVTFKDVIIRNFKTTAAERLALTNASGTVIFDNVAFEDNENGGSNSAEIGEYSDIYFMSWGNASYVFKGKTKVKGYYTGGNIDVSEIDGDAEIKIKAKDENGYEYLKSIAYSDDIINAHYNDAERTVCFDGKEIEPTNKPTQNPTEGWSMNVSRTEDGKILVETVNYSSDAETADIYAAVYDSTGRIIEVKKECINAEPSVTVTNTFEIGNTEDDVVVKIFLWGESTMQPFSKIVTL